MQLRKDVLRKVGRVMAWALGALAVVAVGLVARAKWVTERSYAHVAEPAIVADRSPEGVARGELLFQSLCMECHGENGRAIGKRLDEVPAFLGTFYSANLAHPEQGVARRGDGQIARVLRFGVLPDGRFSPVMSSFGHLGDADVAAVLGYMRSGAAPFAPGGEVQPRTELSVAGALVITYASGVSMDRPATGIPVPRKAADVEYGRYMVKAMDCVGCHTAGFSSEKMGAPGAFAGGFELVDPTGTKIFSKNITMHEATGIGRWSVDDFERAVTRGVTPEGWMVRKPMPLFSRLDRTDVEAIHRFLQTVPRADHPNQPGGHPLRKPQQDDPPEVLFASLGCSSCHGEGRPYREMLRPALQKSDEEVATWILDPQAIKPGSPMPSFGRTIDRAQAAGLARYVKSLVAARQGS